MTRILKLTPGIAASLLCLALSSSAFAAPVKVLAEFTAMHQVGMFIVQIHSNGKVELTQKLYSGSSREIVNTLSATQMKTLKNEIRKCANPELETIEYSATLGSTSGSIEIFVDGRAILLKDVSRAPIGRSRSEMSVSRLECAEKIEEMMSVYHTHHLPTP